MVGEDADVYALGGTDETVEVTAEGAFPPTVAAALADVDLGDAALAGEAEDGIDGIFAIKFGYFGAFCAGGVEALLDTLALFGGPLRAIQMNGNELAVEAVAIASAAVEHAFEVGIGREPNGDALLRPPELLDAVAGEVTLELLIYHIGGEEQGDFSKFGQLVLGEAATSIGFTVGIEAGLGGGIDHDDLVSHLEKVERHGFSDVFASDGFDAFALFLDMLKIDGGDDGDAGFEKLLDILPAFGVGAAERIVVGETIDQADFGGALQYGGQVHDENVVDLL